MDHKLNIILLAGPTASGKSKIAIQLAKSLNGEIINADSMQVYKELKILTSRPSLSDEKKVKHHLYGFISVKKDFSTGNWIKLVKKKINEIILKKKVPILVGGTGLYFNALTKGFVEIPKIPKKFRKKVRFLHQKEGQNKFFKRLLKIALKALNYINKSDTQRTIRAYEVKKYTKKSLYEWIRETKLIYNANIFSKFFINPPRELLLKKINLRVEKMFKNGVKKEVEKFIKLKVPKEHSANKSIGLREIKKYLDKEESLNHVKEVIKIRTRQYAKRQFTWARGKMTSWKMIYPKNYKEILNKIHN